MITMTILFVLIGALLAFTSERKLEGIHLWMPVVIVLTVTIMCIYFFYEASGSISELSSDGKVTFGFASLCWTWTAIKFCLLIIDQYQRNKDFDRLMKK